MLVYRCKKAINNSDAVYTSFVTAGIHGIRVRNVRRVVLGNILKLLLFEVQEPQKVAFSIASNCCKSLMIDRIYTYVAKNLGQHTHRWI